MKTAIADITQRIRERSAPLRQDYLKRLRAAAARPRGAERMGCADVRRLFGHDPEFVRTWQTRKGMRHVGTPHAVDTAWALTQGIDTLQIVSAQGRAALTDAVGDRRDDRVQIGHGKPGDVTQVQIIV